MPRKEDRHSYLREVELEFASGKRNARISDISPGGCYIDTISQAAVDEPIALQISTSYGESMQINGRIAYILDGFGFGVEFVDVTDRQREFLDRLVTSASG
ncbi:MAG TPA: PilZ domain-containing protein [Pyrinomonadaceae bacterium]|nr:PilZ domain-containing protein [Pyrinomonadaceae bacterium]